MVVRQRRDGWSATGVAPSSALPLPLRGSHPQHDGVRLTVDQGGGPADALPDVFVALGPSTERLAATAGAG